MVKKQAALEGGWKYGEDGNGRVVGHYESFGEKTEHFHECSLGGAGFAVWWWDLEGEAYHDRECRAGVKKGEGVVVCSREKENGRGDSFTTGERGV